MSAADERCLQWRISYFAADVKHPRYQVPWYTVLCLIANRMKKQVPERLVGNDDIRQKGQGHTHKAKRRKNKIV